MSGRAPGPAAVAAAATAIGGLLIVALPRQASGIVQLVLVTIAAGAALHALGTHVPPAGWLSPFKWLSPFAGPDRAKLRQHGSDEIDSVRARLAARRQRTEGGPPLPPDTLRLLRPVLETALDVDVTDPSDMADARRRLSPAAWSVLATEPLPRSYWFRTVRPNEWEVAEVVHEILDEIDELPLAARGAKPAPLHPTEAS